MRRRGSPDGGTNRHAPAVRKKLVQPAGSCVRDFRVVCSRNVQEFELIQKSNRYWTGLRKSSTCAAPVEWRTGKAASAL